jgi:hypothetical protein
MAGIAQKILANPAKYSIQQLRQGVENGIIPAYIGIPLIQERMQDEKEAQAMPMAQNQPPIAEQVLAESSGIDNLPTGLPQSYAGGGIIAFEEGGPVERYQNAGLVPNDPQAVADREAMLDTLKRMKAAGMDIATLPGRGLLGAAETAITRPLRALGVPVPYLPESVYGGNRASMTPYYDRLRAQETSAVAPTSTPAAAPYDPATATRRSMFEQQTSPPAAPAIPVISGAGSFKMPTLPSLTLPTGRAPTDLNAIVGDMPAKTKKAFEDKVTEAQGIYEDFDKPGNEAREEKLSKREAGLEKDSAMNRALNLMSLGFGIAGSKERTVAGALGNEGRQGIADLIKGEAANRAAKDRLDDARDNFEQQKVAAKKGNYQAAQQAGQRAADDLRAGTQLTLQAGHYGNTEANQRLQLEQQGVIAKTQLEQQGILGLSELGLKKDQLSQNAAIANAQLANNLAVAQVKANREPIMTPYQMARLRADAEKRVDVDAVRDEVAKQLKLSKVPPAGKDARFEDEFNKAYENKINSHINRFLGTFGGGVGGGGMDFGAINPLLDKYAPPKR